MISKDQIILENLYLKIVKEQDEDFSGKWQAALQNSEELRVAVDLMKNIKSVFPQGEIYIVGGVPRDLLMGNEVDDVDLATNIPFEKLEGNFEIRNISKSDSQPVYDIKWKDYHYDIAKFRTDSGDTGRQNNISTETDSFLKDTERRDLTINSFGLDENGNIVDHQNGLEDLKNKIVRAVGDPKKRFMEDATRILRVFRFAAKMGFDIDEQTKNAAKELKGLLSNSKMISFESIAKEFYKSAKSGKTLMLFLQKLQETGILHDILPEFTSMEGYMHNPKHHPEGGSSVLGHIYECLSVSPFNDPVINLAVLFHDFGKSTTRGEKEGHSTYHGHESAGVPIVENIFKRLKFNELSAEDKKNILQAVDKHMHVHNLDKLNIKTLSKLVLDPSWNVVKSVAYCDEASRGSSHFDKKSFEEKIKIAEEKVLNIGSDSEDLRKKIKQYIDGGKLIQWYPELQRTPKLGILLKKAQDHVLELMNSNQEPNDEEIKKYIDSIFNESFISSFKDYVLKENEQNSWEVLPPENVSIGININDKIQDFTGQVLRGEKTIETRNKNSLKSYIGKKVGIIRTGKGKAYLVGYCIIGEPKIYKSESEFRKDFDKHLVDKGSKFDIPKNGIKFGYPLYDVVKLDEPKLINSRGIISRKI